MKRVLKVEVLSGLLMAAAAPLWPCGARELPLTILYSFCGRDDGGNPLAICCQGQDGSLYGTTYGGGADGAGALFKLDSNRTLTAIYPRVAVVARGRTGEFVGVVFGDKKNRGWIFRLTGDGGAKVLSSFGDIEHAGSPASGLIQGADGCWYGLAAAVGVGGPRTLDSVYRVTTNGAVSFLHNFKGYERGSPSGELLQAADGKLYGVVADGGKGGKGMVFSLTTNGAFGTVYAFTGGADGGKPGGPLVQGTGGCLYGTAYRGASQQSTVFRLTLQGRLDTVHSFAAGAHLNPGLAVGVGGHLYGTTAEGGEKGCGSVFRLSEAGAYRLLHSFKLETEGGDPRGSLLVGRDHYLYGAATAGGVNSEGTIFRIKEP